MIIAIFLFMHDNKKSKGSIDNASGVSILIELIKLFKKSPLENYDIIFLWSGAEEWGLR
jgi:Zn-dependent M28 family amino/carboxypeptidase